MDFLCHTMSNCEGGCKSQECQYYANYHILDLSVMNNIMAIIEGRFDKKVILKRIWSLNN